MGHSLIALNQTPYHGADIHGDVYSLGYNLIGDSDRTTLIGDTTGNLLDILPLLDPLGNYGGFTLTHQLQSMSPAINAGNPGFDPNTFTPPLLTDQRGFDRVSNGRVDIGSTEFVSPGI